MHHLIVFALLLLSLIVAQSAGQERPANPHATYVYQHWQVDNGLPSSDVRSIIQSHDGYIWIATIKGVVRFNGATFRTFNSANTPAFRYNNINVVYEDRDSILWIGCESGGLISYKEGQFTTERTPPEFRDQSIRYLYQDRRGRLWIGTSNTLYYREGNIIHQISDVRLTVRDMAEDSAGNLFVIADRLYNYSDGRMEVVRIDHLRTLAPDKMTVSRDGTLWISSDDQLMHLRLTSRNSLATITVYPYVRRVTDIIEEAPGVLLLSSLGNGLQRFIEGRAASLRGIEGLEGALQNVRSMAYDNEGGLWLATGGGVIHLRKSFIWFLGTIEGLPENTIWTVFEAKDGTIWGSTEKSGTILVKRGKPVKSLWKRNGLPDDRVSAFRETSDGSLWLGGYKEGLVRKRGTLYEDMTRLPGYLGGSVRSLFEDRQHRLWIGTTKGLHQWTADSLRAFPEVIQQAGYRVSAIQEDHEGNLWILAGRIFRRHGDSFRMFPPANQPMPFLPQSLYVDSSRVWFGTYGGGLRLLQGDSIINCTEYESGLGPVILSIFEDDLGYLWINAEVQLQRISKQRLLDLIAGKAKNVDLRIYDHSEGLRNIDFNSMGMHSSYKTRDGALLYASKSGIVLVDPKQVTMITSPPRIVIECLKVDGRDVALSRSIRILPGVKKVDIDFGALTYASIPKIKFRYKLEGIDRDWIESTGLLRSASYSNLSNGSYHFQVIGCNADGVWNEQGAILEFSIAPYFYQTPLFGFFIILLVTGSAIVGYRWRTETLRKRQVELERIVDEKTSALQEEIEIRKSAEEELRIIQEGLEERVQERAAQLKVLNEKYEMIVDTSQEGIWMADEEETTSFVNPKMAEILGYTVNDLTGMDISRFIPAEAKPILNEKKLRRRQGISERYELDFLHKNGSVISTIISASPILDSGGVYKGSLAMIADITNQKRIEKERQQVEEELRQVQKMDVVGRLAGGIAHDFNNLLLPIIGYSEMLLKESSQSETQKKRIATIKKAAETAASLTKQLLSFSRKQVMEFRVHNLNPIIKELQPILRRTIREDIEILLHLDPNLGNFKGDSSQVEQILMNLTINAQDAMPAGGKITIETLNIELDAFTSHRHAHVEPGSYICLIITDTGTGIPADILEHIFEPFFTTKEKGKGTGLGLATVYGTIKQHNGHIWVYSEPGLGTTFRIVLPRTSDDGTVLKPSGTEPKDLTGKEMVVVTEDDEMVRKLACTLLEQNGYHVLEAPTIEICKMYFQEYGSTIDLLVTDVIMPTMNGRELFESIRISVPTLRVLYMSGYSEEVVSHRGVLDKGVTFIQKPFSSDHFLRKVREVLQTT